MVVFGTMVFLMVHGVYKILKINIIYNISVLRERYFYNAVCLIIRDKF